YFITCDGNTCAVYHKDGKKFSNDFSIKSEEIKNAKINENLGIAELFNGKGNLVKSIDFNPVYPFKEEIIDYTKLLNI
ncbi:MAG: hypothetical protein ACP5QP_08285, partial [Brevinematia bacterium]